MISFSHSDVGDRLHFFIINVQSLLGGHFAALFNSGNSSVGGCDRTQHLQAGDAQSQKLRRAGRATAAATAYAEV